MPQMAPLMWTSLFIFFTFLLILAMTKIFFSKSESQKLPNLFSMGKTSKMNWKW